MKNRGFTLIELLAVISILAIIMLIATPRVLDTIEESRANAYKTDEQMMVKAAETYLANNIDLIPENLDDGVIVNVSDLKSSNYINDFGNENCDGHILIKKTGTAFEYIPHLECDDYRTPNVIEDDLLMHYGFGDEMTGNQYNDLSGNGNVGTNYGAVLGTDRFGNVTGATLFDGVDDYVDMTLLNNNNMTVTFWRKAVDDTRWLLFGGQSSSYYLMAVSTGNFYSGSSGSSLTYYEDGEIALTDLRDDQWHFYAISDADIAGWTVFYLNHYSSWYYKGYIDDLKIYNRILTSEEIKHNYLVEKN